jgi:hypothetical protein
MTSFRQIEANRRNAQLSTGPVTEEGKRRSRQNAVGHGLTAETVIDALEDAEDYAPFEAVGFIRLIPSLALPAGGGKSPPGLSGLARDPRLRNTDK